MKINRDSFSFQLNNMQYLVIRDAHDQMNLDLLFQGINRSEMKDLLNRYRIPAGEMMEVMCLYINTGNKKILIDTGWGTGRSPDSGKLPSVLKTHGIEPGDIDHVIISHGHPDHIGGNTDTNGRAVFPNAGYIMLKGEWEFWESMPKLNRIEDWVEKEIHKYVENNLLSIKDRIELVDIEEEILPGFRFIKVPGHTPHHCMISIDSDSERLLYLSDLLQHPLQIAYPDKSTFVDYEPEQAVKKRSETLTWIESAKILCFACHFTFPGLGYVVKKGDIRMWEPWLGKNDLLNETEEQDFRSPKT